MKGYRYKYEMGNDIRSIHITCVRLAAVFETRSYRDVTEHAGSGPREVALGGYNVTLCRWGVHRSCSPWLKTQVRYHLYLDRFRALELRSRGSRVGHHAAYEARRGGYSARRWGFSQSASPRAHPRPGFAHHSPSTQASSWQQQRSIPTVAQSMFACGRRC
jgi:hypothetical protein